MISLKKKITYFFFSLSIICFFLIPLGNSRAQSRGGDPSTTPPSVGVFYYPGWRDGVPGLAFSPPWRPIQKFPEREPMLGWYDDGNQETIDSQLRWMGKYGIDYVVFDWYWGRSGTFLDQSVRSYLTSKVADKIPFAIMWANHDAEPTGLQSYQKMVDYWIKNYLKEDGYLQFNGRPVVYIFSAEQFKEKAVAIGRAPSELLSMAQTMAKAQGLIGISFFMGTSAGSSLVKEADDWGIDGYFAYNYHSGVDGLIDGVKRSSRSFAELDRAYKSQWNWFLHNSKLPYVLPVTAGWDRRAWGGSVDPLHDYSSSIPLEFSAHLQFARDQLAVVPGKANINSVLVCCWNEFGEGSIVEPTKKFGFQYLDSIREMSPGRQIFGK